MKENPETFIKTIESAKTLYGWSDQQTLAYAGLSLKGKALDWHNNQEATQTWPSFKKALIQRFGLDPNKMLSALTRRVQGEKESVRDYADALRTLVRYSRDPHLQATLLHFFTEGLREDVASFVKTRRPLSFEEAVKEGEYYEDNFRPGAATAQPARGHSAAAALIPTATRTTRRAQQENLPPADPSVEALTRKMESLTLKLHDLDAKLAVGAPAGQRPRLPAAACYECGEEGHLAKDCPRRRRNTAVNFIEY